MSELERLNKLKQEAIENPPQKVKGCKSCKKKKEVEVKGNTELPVQYTEFIPSIEDIKKVYIMLGGPKEEEKPYIKKVYEALFHEEFDFNCRSCVHTQTRILKNYITNTLKIKL
jgi:hypothetical protein